MEIGKKIGIKDKEDRGLALNDDTDDHSEIINFLTRFGHGHLIGGVRI